MRNDMNWGMKPPLNAGVDGYIHISTQMISTFAIHPERKKEEKKQKARRKEMGWCKNKVSPSDIVAIPSAYQWNVQALAQRGRTRRFDGFRFHSPAPCGLTTRHLSIVPTQGYTNQSLYSQKAPGKKGSIVLVAWTLRSNRSFPRRPQYKRNKSARILT